MSEARPKERLSFMITQYVVVSLSVTGLAASTLTAHLTSTMESELTHLSHLAEGIVQAAEANKDLSSISRENLQSLNTQIARMVKKNQSESGASAAIRDVSCFGLVAGLILAGARRRRGSKGRLLLRNQKTHKLATSYLAVGLSVAGFIGASVSSGLASSRQHNLIGSTAFLADIRAALNAESPLPDALIAKTEDLQKQLETTSNTLDDAQGKIAFVGVFSALCIAVTSIRSNYLFTSNRKGANTL